MILLRGVNLLEENFTKLSLRKMCDVLVITATDNREQTEILLKWVVGTLRDQVQTKFRLIFTVYKRLVQITDDLMDTRLEALEEIIRQTANETYFL